jgi:hypothetical protein
MAVVQTVFCQTPEQNLAAFQGSAGITNLSYHWDAMSGGVPQVATTPRTVLPYAPSLTTLVWDPVNRPDLYQQKVIDSVLVNCTLVGTFANPNGFWNQAPGTAKELTFMVGDTTHYIFPYVTAGNDLKSYLSQTYFTTDVAPDSAEVSLRIQQSLGLPAADASTRGLAFFWVPMDNIIRSGYSADPATLPSNLATFSDGSYQPVNANVPGGYHYVDVANNTITYSGPGSIDEFTEFNQAQTTFPWSAMGYTYNWNALQDGSNPAFGFDPSHAQSIFGLSEFMVSGGSDILLDSWIPYSDFGTWVVSVPEPGTYVLLLFGAGVLVLRRRFMAAK